MRTSELFLLNYESNIDSTVFCHVVCLCVLVSLISHLCGLDESKEAALTVAKKGYDGMRKSVVDCQTVVWASVFIFFPAGAH